MLAVPLTATRAAPKPAADPALKTVEEVLHAFKAGWVGKSNVSRFNAMRDGEGSAVLVRKDGKVLVPTH